MSKKLQFIVLNEYSIQKYDIAENHIVISITSPGYTHPKLPELKSRIGLLQLKFHDIDKSFVSKGITYAPISKEQAKSIWEFFSFHKDRTKAVICQCEVGVCRSPAVAAALAKGIGQSDEKFFKYYAPNMFVYRTLLNIIKGI